MNSVLLTIDLTKAVADEAIERNDSIVIAYRMYRKRGIRGAARFHESYLTSRVKRRSHHLPRTQELDFKRHAAAESAEVGRGRHQCVYRIQSLPILNPER